MKIEADPTQKVEQSHVFQQVACTIDAEDMRYVASLLRNNYSNTQLAVIREISANALDANKEYEHDTGNKARQIEIDLPSRMSPIFSVRDFGTGLSQKDMFGLYSKYGKSTKRDSNLAIGGFGIGKFAPLSYGDNFTVVSYHGGEKASFNVFVDENDDTKILEMTREPSDEPTGLCVQVTVADEDVDSFIETARDFFKIFPKDELPKFLGKDESFISAPEIVFEGDNWFLSDESNGYSYGRTNAFAVMGRVRYPLTSESINFSDDDKDSHALRELLSTRGFYVTFDIGELKLHHSRESLEYNKATQKKIIERLREVNEDLAEHAKDKLANSKDFWEAKMNHAVVMNSLPQGIRRVLGTAFKWNGHSVDGARFNKPQWQYVYHGTSSSNKLAADAQNKIAKAIEIRVYEKRTAPDVADGFKVQNSECNSVHAMSNATLMKRDVDSHGMVLRVRTYFRDNPDKDKVYVINVKSDGDAALQKKAWEWLDNNWHVDEMDAKNYQPMSNFEKAKIAKKKGVKNNSRANCKIFKLSGRDIVDVSQEDADTLIEEAEDNGEKILYLPIYRFKIEHEKHTHDFLMQLITNLREEASFNKDIYCIRVSDAKKLDVNLWENAYATLKKSVLAEISKHPKELGDQLLKGEWNKVNWYDYDISKVDGGSNSIYRRIQSDLGDSHEIVVALKLWRKHGRDTGEATNALFQYVDMFEDKQIAKIAKCDKKRVGLVKKELAEVSAKYRLLFAYCDECSHWRSPAENVLKSIVDYVKLIDNQ